MSATREERTRCQSKTICKDLGSAGLYLDDAPTALGRPRQLARVETPRSGLDVKGAEEPAAEWD
ncbi:MAG: hypothetical protein ACYS0G_08195 [Planctomycetota bacterium]